MINNNKSMFVVQYDPLVCHSER